MKPWIESPFSIVIVAPTGRGKTVLANAGHVATSRLSVFFNTQDKGYVRGQRVMYGGARHNDRLTDAVRRGASMLNVVPQSTSGADELAALVDWLWPLASGDVDVAVWVDEAHDVAPVGSKGTPLHRLAKRGRDPGSGDGGIKTASITQRFTGLEKSIRTEAEYVAVVGIPSTEDWDDLEDRVGIDMEELRALHGQQKFQQTVQGGETVSRAFSVYKSGSRCYGPSVVAAKYARSGRR